MLRIIHECKYFITSPEAPASVRRRGYFFFGTGVGAFMCCCCDLTLIKVTGVDWFLFEEMADNAARLYILGHEFSLLQQ